MNQQETHFVEVLLPLALSKTLSYRVPLALNSQLEIGKRVVVPFRNSKFYSGLITHISTLPPKNFEAKYIVEVLDSSPIVSAFQLDFWQWIANYYMCTLGEVMIAALPSSFKLSGESAIILNKNILYEKKNFSDEEYLLVEALELQPILSIADANKILGKENLIATVNSLIEQGVVMMAESIQEKVKPLVKTFVRLPAQFNVAVEKEILFKKLESKPKQLNLLLAYSKLLRIKSKVSRAELISEAQVSSSVLTTLVERGIFEVYEEIVSRLGEEDENYDNEISNLSTAQEDCFHRIKEQFESKDVVLLHGITSSGKTHVFIKLIEDYLAKNEQVLFLLPEIALTTQIVFRLQKYFGQKIGVYHSRFNDQEKAEIWKKIQNGEYSIVLGARSAVFMPFKNLGLVIIDEEHDASYKQQDPAPRYHARDIGIYLAHKSNAKTLLGSATPSLETYYHSENKKYGFVSLNERFGKVTPPEIVTANITEETSKKTMQSHFCSQLLHEIELKIANKEQVILFQNRRGYVPILICKTCAYTPKCVNCDVSLTHHKSSEKLHCHYCGYQQSLFQQCPVCGSNYIEQKGFGTEKIEEDLNYFLPDVKVSRLDQDATRRKNSFQQIINDFEEQKTSILVGTQMVAKGLDFKNVTLIGIVNADALLRFPEFRANERSFQILTQVAGRAGRRDKVGKVIIQTHQPENEVIKDVIEGNYVRFYEREIAERNSFFYPPFCKMIQLEVRHREPNQLNYTANALAVLLRTELPQYVIGPEFPFISRIKNLYIKTLLLKIPPSLSYQKVKEYITNCINIIEQDKNNRSCSIQIDVDPY